MIPINVFSIIISFIVGYILCRKETMHGRFINLLSLAVIIHISAFRGYFLLLGKSSEISYDLVISLILLIYAVVYIYREDILLENNGVFFTFLFFCVSFISIFIAAFFPYENNIIDNNTLSVGWDAYVIGSAVKVHATIGWTRLISYFTFVLAYFFVLLILKQKGTRGDLLCIVKCVNAFIIFAIVFTIFEYVSKNILGNNVYEPFMSVIFGTSSSTFSDLRMRGDGYQLQAFSREPAHLAYMFYWGIVFILLEKKILIVKSISKTNIIEMLIISLIMFYSGSFSTYIYLGVIFLFILWLFISKYKLSFRYKACCAFTVVLIVCSIYDFLDNLDESSYIGNRIALGFLAIDLISAGLGAGLGPGSEIARFTSIYDTSWDFFHRPIFGLGPCIQVSHSAFINILSDVGIAGVYCWWKTTISNYNYKIVPIVILLLLPNIVLGVLTVSPAFAIYTAILVECFKIDKVRKE